MDAQTLAVAAARDAVATCAGGGECGQRAALQFVPLSATLDDVVDLALAWTGVRSTAAEQDAESSAAAIRSWLSDLRELYAPMRVD